MNPSKGYYLCALMLLLSACTSSNSETHSPESPMQYAKGTFGYDVQTLSNPILLQAGEVMAVLSTEYQGRVMTTSATGMEGYSFGWLNHDLIQSGEFQKGITPVGGEDRFWLGPEGGQFAVFFPPNSDFSFSDWQTPPAIDSEPFQLVSQEATSAQFARNIQLTNYANTRMNIEVKRNIRLLSGETLASVLEVSLPETVSAVGVESENTITNAGENAWTKETGAVSIWILGMLIPSDQTTIVLPYESDAEGQIVNDSYFGEVSTDRLKVEEGFIFFKGDGKSRGKIGVPPGRARSVCGSYDAENQVLTIVTFTLPEGATDYVNSIWEIQEAPFGGDVVNSYNDGPLENGGQLGPFYELESSSPAAFLTPGASMTHVHRTYHFQGDEAQLSQISEAALGIRIVEIKEALGK